MEKKHSRKRIWSNKESKSKMNFVHLTVTRVDFKIDSDKFKNLWDIFLEHLDQAGSTVT